MPIHPIDPVYLWDGYVSKGLIDIEGAARFLIERWPDDRGTAFRGAARACEAALHGRGSADAARAAIVAAAEEADILDRKAMAAPVRVPGGGVKTRWRPPVSR